MSSAAKVFQVLEAVVAGQARGLAYSEVVARTHIPKATAHRVLKSLLQMGYLRFDAEAGRYFGDLKLASLGSAVTSHFDLKGYVHPLLLKLQTETSHTCNLGVLSGDAGVYLDKIESPMAFGIKLYSEIGKRFPLHCTAMGKVLLAGVVPAEARRLLAGRLEAYTPHTITSPSVLKRELATVRLSGYALDREEITRGIVCVAAPIRDGEGGTIAAISVAFPAYINEERGIQAEIRAVTRCAAGITTALAGPGARDDNEIAGTGRRSARHPQRG
jgi:DNA-binding IclR family transcriptional regulator